MKHIPTIDLNNINDESLAAMDTACRDHGFFLLTGHGIDELLVRVKQQAEVFFKLPLEEKRRVMRAHDNPMGYYDRELTKQKRDLKEVFDFYARDDENREQKMPWPDNLPAFKATLREYFLANIALSKRVLHLVARSLGIAENSFDSGFDFRPTSTARLNYYPSEDPLADDETNIPALGDMALHHHTDQGAVTLLFQDNIGGLQAHSPEDGWIDVPPLANALVVNMGDIVQVWSNGQYKAALHRVTPVPKGQSRYSLPFFYQPNFETAIEPHPELGSPVYRKFQWEEFIRGRINDNYADLGEDDIQIERFRIN